MDKLALNDGKVARSGSGAAPSRQDVVESLEAQSDETLSAMIAQANAILDERATTRRKDALAAIRRLARENGLDVSVKKPARRRGRPARKADTALG